MRYAALLLAVSISICGCDPYTGHKGTDASTKRVNDSLRKLYDSTVSHWSVKRDSIKKEALCPVKITRQLITKNEIDNPEATITFKNLSDKTIDGIKMNIVCSNNFGDYLGTKNCISQDVFSKGKSITNTWTLYGKETTTRIHCEVYSVHFKDGSKWGSDL